MKLTTTQHKRKKTYETIKSEHLSHCCYSSLLPYTYIFDGVSFTHKHRIRFMGTNSLASNSLLTVSDSHFSIIFRSSVGRTNLFSTQNPNIPYISCCNSSENVRDGKIEKQLAKKTLRKCEFISQNDLLTIYGHRIILLFLFQFGQFAIVVTRSPYSILKRY